MHTANTAHKNRNGKYRFHSQAVTTVTVPLTVSPFLKKDNLGNSCVSGWPKTPKTSTAATGNSPISRAAQLSGSLLLIHGTADDNVHFRNFVEVSEAYVQSDKPFAQQLYTNRNHNIYGGNTRYHLFKTITRFFDEKLK